jgi:hypothetical protein
VTKTKINLMFFAWDRNKTLIDLLESLENVFSKEPPVLVDSLIPWDEDDPQQPAPQSPVSQQSLGTPSMLVAQDLKVMVADLEREAEESVVNLIEQDLLYDAICVSTEICKNLERQNLALSQHLGREREQEHVNATSEYKITAEELEHAKRMVYPALLVSLKELLHNVGSTKESMNSILDKIRATSKTHFSKVLAPMMT